MTFEHAFIEECHPWTRAVDPASPFVQVSNDIVATDADDGYGTDFDRDKRTVLLVPRLDDFPRNWAPELMDVSDQR